MTLSEHWSPCRCSPPSSFIQLRSTCDPNKSTPAFHSNVFIPYVHTCCFTLMHAVFMCVLIIIPFASLPKQEWYWLVVREGAKIHSYHRGQEKRVSGIREGSKCKHLSESGTRRLFLALTDLCSSHFQHYWVLHIWMADLLWSSKPYQEITIIKDLTVRMERGMTCVLLCHDLSAWTSLDEGAASLTILSTRCVVHAQKRMWKCWKWLEEKGNTSGRMALEKGDRFGCIDLK
jgi:hypothetical protein